MPLIPLLGQTISDRVTYTVKVDGSEINADYQIVGLEVRREVNRIPFAIVELIDGDAAEKDFPASNEDLFLPGKELEILLGYEDENETIFKGIIVRHKIKSVRRRSRLILEAKDEAVKMTLTRKNAYYYDSLDSDVISDLISEYGLSADVESGTVQHKELVKYNVSDWDFIVCRAETSGMIVLVEDGKVKVQKPVVSGSPAASLEYGVSIFEFEAEMDARNQHAGVKGNTWDYTNQEVLTEEASEPSDTGQGNVDGPALADSMGASPFELYHSGKVEDAELLSWAEAKLLKSRLARIMGRVRTNGNPAILPGTLIELLGVGDRFNGNAFVSAVAHSLEEGSWFTEVQFGLSPKWFQKEVEDVVDSPASGLIPAIGGLQIGVVVKLQDDPDGEFRVQVRIPVINKDEEGVWARLASLDAGENRGWVFRPEIDDEVIVGFVNDDPRDPVVLGMLHSSAKPAPIEGSDDNHEKGLITRGEMKLHFNDDLNNLEISTPGGNKVLLSEENGELLIEDENGNKILLSSSGIDMESAKDINIKASGDVNIEGTNVNVKASAQFKGEGSGGAEVSTSASLTLKGSIVQIN